MNKKMEEQLQDWGNKEEHVPEFFSKGIDDALNNLPPLHSQLPFKQRKNKSAAKKMGISAAILAFGILGSGFVSPTMAKMLQEVPIVGSIFAHSSDSSLQVIKEKGLASTLNETVTDNGVSLTITEAFFGGGRLAIGYMIETNKAELTSLEKGQGTPLSFQALLNGERFTYMADVEQSVTDGIATGIIDMGVGLESELSAEPVLQLKVNEISGIKGAWNFNIPVSNKETAAATASFTPMVSTSWGQATFVVEKAEFTPARSQIIIDRTIPRDELEHYSFAVYDENGTSLGFAGGSGSSIIDKGNDMINFKDTILLPGLEEAPSGLIIEILNNHGRMFDASMIKEVAVPLNEVDFPYAIPYPDESQFIITNFEQLEDKTIVHYDIKGNLGLQNTFLMLEDEQGERFVSEKDAERTSLERLSFKKEFPKTSGPISFITEMEKIKLVDKKAIKINLESE